MQPLKLMFEQKPVYRAVDQFGTDLALYSDARGARMTIPSLPGWVLNTLPSVGAFESFEYRGGHARLKGEGP
jgi:hypothetical protein